MWTFARRKAASEAGLLLESPEYIEIDENGRRFLVDVRQGHGVDSTWTSARTERSSATGFVRMSARLSGRC